MHIKIWALEVDSGPQYNDDDIKIVWHPRAGREPEIISFEEWGQRMASKPAIVTNKAPWRPYFQTREDFELADIFRRNSMNKKDQNKVIELIRAGTNGSSNVTFTSAADVEKAWEFAKMDLVDVCAQ